MSPTVVAALVMFARGAEPQSPINLSVELGKNEFFEGEPIYALFRVVNSGRDTAWMNPLDFNEDRLTVAISHQERGIVPELRVWIDYAVSPDYRGIPVGPLDTVYKAIVLQNRWGDADSDRIFVRHLGAGTYTLRARFKAAVRPDASSGDASIEASSPITFAVRSRSPDEEGSYRDVAAVSSAIWDRARQGRYISQLIDLVEHKQRGDSADPYLAYLVNDGVVTARAAGIVPDKSQADRLMQLKIAIAQAQGAKPAGALAALSAFLAEPDLNPPVSQRLRPSLAREVVRDRERRRASHTDR